MRPLKIPITTVFNFFHLSFIQVSNAALQILIFPVMIRLVGLEEFGKVMVANAFAALMGIMINYGTNQSGIKDVAIIKNDQQTLSEGVSLILCIRVLLFVASLLILTVLSLMNPNGSIYFVFAMVIAFSEILNPLFFFVGIERLFLYNISNLIAKIISLSLIFFLIKERKDGYLINFYIGLPSLIVYTILTLFTFYRYRLTFIRPEIKTLKDKLIDNFFLACNSVSVHLQQSSFLFILSYTGNAILLGAYALCDKLIWACRLLIISFSSAIYPGAAIQHNNAPMQWQNRKKAINKALFIVFTICGLCFLLMPSWIILLFTGEKNELSVYLLRIMSIAPLLIALNAMNLLELLIRDMYRSVFYISLIILFISILTGLIFVYTGKDLFAGLYPVVVEAFCLMLYVLYLKKNRIPAAQTGY